MNELDKVLAEWANLEWVWPHSPKCKCGAVDNDDSKRSWYSKEGNDYHLATRFYHEDIDFGSDLTACFKWLEPKAMNPDVKFILEMGGSSQKPTCILSTMTGNEYIGYGEDAPSAYCDAMVRLKDGEK